MCVLLPRAKFNIFETGTHIPLVIRAPWLVASVGQHTDVLAEATDLYPTMAALCGLPPPQQFEQEVNGTDLSPIFEVPVPSPGSGDGLKAAAFSQFGKGAVYGEVPTNFTLENRFRRDQTFLMGCKLARVYSNLLRETLCQLPDTA
jgi:arylsulfatase A-like enzyme